MFIKIVAGENREETSELTKHLQKPCPAARTLREQGA
jgi:hypothetical protein